MIASFKKLTLLIHHSERELVTDMLQKIGVVDVEVSSNLRNENVQELERGKNNLTKAIEVIEDHAEKKLRAQEIVPDFNTHVVEKIMELKYQSEENVQKREALRKEKLHRLPWGNLDLEKLNRLKSHGLEVQFCIATLKEFKKYNFGSDIVQEVYQSANRVYFVVITKEKASLPFESVKVPDQSLSEISSSEEKIETENEKIEQEIATYVPFIPHLKRELINVDNKLAFAITYGSYKTYGEGSILSLMGWFPKGMEDKLVKFLKKRKLTYFIEDPGPESDVPILLLNKSYSKLFEPLTKIFELPNYYELDLTPLIAVFYPIMFAYCLGDAGYGLVFLIASVVGLFTFFKHEKPLATLGIILGLFTTVMGIIKSGSIFGIPTTAHDSWLLFQFLRQYVIIPDDRTFLFNAFNVALMFGVVQILVGIIISIINKIKFEGWFYAISQMGKLLIVTSVIWIFLADMQGVESIQSYSVLRKSLLLIGILMVLFFHDLNQKVLIRAANGFLPLFFIFTGILGDVLSYVRLFALGVASSVLGLVVNQIGIEIFNSGWWGIILGIVFLIFGHTLNFFIAVMGAFVHPLRLSFVEFYNNAQFKGGGKAYQPFRKENINFE
ncbi:V-type ATP synthase subunit I [Flexithrix dorotheae]|uniref:V-type ATP synthase subunit I n=1 Tax=Flexithrix dorotheae TaxID=70993 RepID=UPI000366A0B1|nr:V-type ATP synthase subunit I [Flexithrix dorotheae]